MASIEVKILGQIYELSSTDSSEHLQQVAEMVRRKIESFRKQKPNLNLHKATMLAAFDIASTALKGRQEALQYQSQILNKAHNLLQSVETELKKAAVN